jgi:hypothetical protein
MKHKIKVDEKVLNTKMAKTKKGEKLIIGYGWYETENHPLPIFKSELYSFKGKLYKTFDKAKECKYGK